MNELMSELIAACEEADPEVEQLKAGMGHAACVGWGVFGEPHVVRCSCGEPIRRDVTVAAG